MIHNTKRILYLLIICFITIILLYIFDDITTIELLFTDIFIAFKLEGCIRRWNNMQLSKRQKDLLDYLIQIDNFVTAKQLSEKFRVADKTIYRDMKVIKDFLKPFGDIVLNIPSHGYRINYEKYVKNLVNFEDKQYNQCISVEDRRKDILLRLLLQSPKETSINKLSEDYLVSPASIANDFKAIEEYLEDKSDIKLVKTTTGTYLSGKEASIRKWIMLELNKKAFAKSLEIEMLNKMDSHSIQLLKKNFGQEDILAVKNILDDTEKRLGFLIEDPYYVNVFTHILILIKRFREEGLIESEESILQEEIIDKRILKVAKSIQKSLEDYLQNSLPKNELQYIYSFLSFVHSNENIIDQQEDYDINPSSIYVGFVKKLVERVSDKMQIDFSKDTQLFKSLILHIKPMFKRIRFGIRIQNPLIIQIKKEFKVLYQVVNVVVNDLVKECSLGKVSEDEIGYITIYFQNSIENLRLPLKILIVCSTGIGTSHLLKTRVMKLFPEWEIVGVTSAIKVENFLNDHRVDLILSTVKLKEKSIPTVYVNVFFNEKDVKQILEIIYLYQNRGQLQCQK
jgi:activator of the mannose operon, transcriptional antiterminator